MPMVRMDIDDSDAFTNVGYDALEMVLELTFTSGHTYRYSNFGQLDALAFAQAPSKGQYYHAFIKGRYPERKIS